MSGFLARFPRARAIVEEGIEQGLHLGAQVYVSIHAAVLADDATGEARRDAPLTPDTLMPWYSAVKPLLAVCIAQLVEESRLDYDDYVVDFVPELGPGDKERMTLRHLLTHLSGLPQLDFYGESLPWDAIVHRICRADLLAPPGERAAYNTEAAWYLLAEVLRRVDGRPYDRYLREMLCEPLGMNDTWVGIPAHLYDAYGQRAGVLHDTSGTHVAPVKPRNAQEAVPCRPGSGGYGPIRELGMLYEMLLGKGERNGVRILRPGIVAELTRRHRTGKFDETFQHKVDWGLGFLINSSHYGPQTVPYSYGLHASERTFGHGGMQSSAGFADPEHGLVIAALFNGMPGEARHGRRIRRLATALYEDLRLPPH
jgi:CubicO group peptidase (beta-lactamase class C family)